MKKNILVVDDEKDIVDLLSYNLSKEGFVVITARNGKEALEKVKQKPDLIILDLMMPGMSGLQVIQEVKKDKAASSIPILILTAKGTETDEIVGLEVGADDYITKPFSIKVLIARLRALLRRKNRPPTDKNTVIRIHDLMINPGRHEVLIKGKPVEMTFSELRILHLLAGRPGWVMTREQIVDAVRGEDYAVTDRAVDVQIVGIRKKLGARADYIETVRGVGYRFKE